jgi:bifunctional non-homologous end joining protein LigD
MQQRNFAVAPPPRSLAAFPVSFIAFDLCWRNGEDIRHLSLRERRTLLEAVELVDVAPTVEGEGCAFYRELVTAGFEGMVAKRYESAYLPGVRSRAWRKIKAVGSERAIVVGFTSGTGQRIATFGSLVMAQWTAEGLILIGEVGTGFDEAALRALRAGLDEIVTPDAPVVDPPRIPGVSWVEPGIVISVEHRGWTREGRLRAPSFKGVVPGAEPASVTRLG